jgi:predicted nuclease of predicted toxin-antitoxin system
MTPSTSPTLELRALDPGILRAASDQDRVLMTADADFGALLALGSLATPSVVLLRSADHMPPGEQADLLTANLPAISDALGKGAIASLSRGRLRLRALPIAVESDQG